MPRGSRVCLCLAVTAAVTTGLAVPARASFPGANGKISFTQSSYYSISTINPDGTGEQVLLDYPPRRNEAAWSPDGTRLVYRRGNPPSGDPGLAVVNADGTDDHFIRNDPGAVERDPAWSPDGTKIVYWRQGSDDGVIFVANSDGSGAATPLTTAGATYSTEPAWSPDGTKIAFKLAAERFPGNYELSDIWTMNADGTGKVNLTDTLGVSETQPNWSSDGSKIVYGSGVDGIVVMDADGGNKTAIATPGGWPVWSPDGTKVLYTDGTDLLTVNPDGTDPTVVRPAAPLGNPEYLDWQPLPVPYPRPKGATPLRVSLVPAHGLCSSPNREHGPPLAFGSCNPPVAESAQLTTGTPDLNGQATGMSGFVRYETLVGNPATPADEADLSLRVEITDVREQGSLADYAGEVQAQASTRLTNRDGGVTATVSDVLFPLTTQCAPTADATIGSTCSLTTTLDTLIPGAVVESARTILQLGQVRVVDGGPDGDPTTAPNTVFLRQGIFVP